MAKIYSLFIDAPIEKVWKFVWDFEEWAELINGYVYHERKSDTLSHWCYQIDISLVKKKIEFDLEILSVNEPNSITFQINGTNESFTGHGNLEAKPLKSNRTFVTASIDLQANGPLVKMIKPLLKSNPPTITREFQMELSKRIQQYV